MKNVCLVLALSLTACGGSSGSNGSSGVNGLNGTNGSNGLTVSSEITCSIQDGGAGQTLDYSYEVITYSTGDKQVICSISNSGAQYSNEQFWRYNASPTGGNYQGTCNVNYDVDSGTFGNWTFTSYNGTTKVIYNDASSAHNGYTYTFTGCTNI